MRTRLSYDKPMLETEGRLLRFDELFDPLVLREAGRAMGLEVSSDRYQAWDFPTRDHATGGCGPAASKGGRPEPTHVRFARCVSSAAQEGHAGLTLPSFLHMADDYHDPLLAYFWSALVPTTQVGARS